MKTSITHPLTRCAILRLSAITLIASSSAALALPTVVDSFLTGAPNYTVGSTNLIGQGPTALGFTGTWIEAYGGAQSPDVIATGLTYTDGTNSVAAAGGAIEYPAGGGGRAGRLLGSPYGDTTAGTVYFAVMIKPETTGTGYRGFELHNGGFGDGGGNRKLQIVTGEDGLSDFTVRLFFNPNDGFSATVGTANTDVNFFVGKFTFSTTSDSDSLDVWMNPSNLSSESLSGSPQFSKAGFNMQFDRTSIARFNAGDGVKVDEIRFGSSWSDVTTVVNNTDADADGLPDVWEITYDFDPNDNGTPPGFVVNGPNGNPDNDGSTNLQEFTRGTNPRNPDTDDDGLNDGPEFTAGTNPLDGDSDDDGLKDGAEITAMTNPLVADTDRDGENDGSEVFQGTNPLLASSSSALQGRVVMDGIRDSALYGPALAVQTVETQFGDNFSEWNAAYSIVSGGKLYLLFTGNLEANFNKLSIFIDSTSTVTTTTFTSAGNDVTDTGTAANMDGMTFDSGFAPDYHLIARRGSSKFDLDIAKLGASPVFSNHPNVFAGAESGRGNTVTGPGNNQPIVVAYNGNNVLGISGGTAAANQAAAAAVTTGLELCIDLADIGNPTGPIKIMIAQNNGDHNFLSNQTLGGLPAGTGNLGNPSAVDFSIITGDQFFTVGGTEDLKVLSSRLATPTQFEFIAQGLTLGATYILQDSTTLASFADLGASFVATNTVQVFPATVNTATPPNKRFFRVKRL